MAERPENEQQGWVESQEKIWGDLRKREQRRRDFLWLLFALLLLVIGNLTGFPARFFT